MGIERGCFGSTMMFQARSPECERCNAAPRCAEEVSRARELVARASGRIAEITGEPARVEVNARLDRDVRQASIDETRLQMTREIAADWEARKINLFLLKHGKTPITQDETEGEIFYAVSQAKRFSIKDIVDAVLRREKIPKARVEKRARSIIYALCDLKVAKQIKRGLYEI